MKNKILLIIGMQLMMISLVSAGFYYNVNLSYDKGIVKIDNVDVVYSNWDLTEVYDDFLPTYKIILGEKEYLFNINNEAVYDSIDENGNVNGTGVIYVDSFKKEMYIPYFYNAKEIEIRKDDKKIDSYSVIQFTEYYNREDYGKMKSNEANLESNFSDKKELESIEKDTKNDYSLIIIAVLGIVLIGLIIYYIIKINSKPGKKK